MPRKDPDAYRQYMRDYTRNKRREKKMLGEPTQDADDFNVATATITQGTEKLDLNSKQALAILEKAKSMTKDPVSEEEDPVMKYIEKGMKYLPIIMEAFKGFNMASNNFQQKQQRPTIQPPNGWESMNSLARLGKKYSDPAWYEAGERWENYKTTGTVSTVNTGYVDPTYTTPPPAQDLRQLAQKHPEPPLVKDQEPKENFTETEPQRKPEFVKKVQEKRGETTEEPKGDETTMIVNALREDNNKYIELAFNYLASLEMNKFIGYCEKPETFKPKMGMLTMLLPFQTKEMIKNTPTEEFMTIFKEKAPDKHKWLKENKKLPELKALFEELKNVI